MKTWRPRMQISPLPSASGLWISISEPFITGPAAPVRRRSEEAEDIIFVLMETVLKTPNPKKSIHPKLTGQGEGGRAGALAHAKDLVDLHVQRVEELQRFLVEEEGVRTMSHIFTHLTYASNGSGGRGQELAAVQAQSLADLLEHHGLGQAVVARELALALTSMSCTQANGLGPTEKVKRNAK